jgi:hypothetical protein
MMTLGQSRDAKPAEQNHRIKKGKRAGTLKELRECVSIQISVRPAAPHHSEKGEEKGERDNSHTHIHTRTGCGVHAHGRYWQREEQEGGGGNQRNV